MFQAARRHLQPFGRATCRCHLDRAAWTMHAALGRPTFTTVDAGCEGIRTRDVGGLQCECRYSCSTCARTRTLRHVSQLHRKLALGVRLEGEPCQMVTITARSKVHFAPHRHASASASYPAHAYAHGSSAQHLTVARVSARVPARPTAPCVQSVHAPRLWTRASWPCPKGTGTGRRRLAAADVQLRRCFP
jgi:hypothetical protein